MRTRIVAQVFIYQVCIQGVWFKIQCSCGRSRWFSGGWSFVKVHNCIFLLFFDYVKVPLPLAWSFKAFLPVLEMFVFDLHSLHPANDGSLGTFAIHNWKIGSVSQNSLNVNTECFLLLMNRGNKSASINFYTKSKEKQKKS